MFEFSFTFNKILFQLQGSIPLCDRPMYDVNLTLLNENGRVMYVRFDLVIDPRLTSWLYFHCI